MAATAEVIQTGTQEIPLSSLRAAPWNARKTFDETTLAELAASIKKGGINVPLIVRPKGNNFEIVAGERRSRAAKMAGKETAPCIVRDLTDNEAREIGMIDNLQRENLAPLDEAKAFADLIKPKDKTIQTVAADMGKDPSYIARRLKLLNAIQPVQDALTNAAIEVGHALELARLDEKQQARLFNWLRVVADGTINVGDEDDEDFDDNEEFEDEEDDDTDDDTPEAQQETAPQSITWRQTPYSVAELRREIGRTMLHVLSDAPFPLEDNIAPMPCTECSKRSINSTLLFNDVKQDTCTDAACYNGKLRAWVRVSLDYAEHEGKKLVLLGSQYWYQQKDIVRAQNVVVIKDASGERCESTEDAIWYDGEKMGHTVTICRNTNCKTHYGFRSPNGNGAGETASRKPSPERKKLLAKVNVQKRYRKALFEVLGAVSLENAKLFDIADQLSLDISEHCINRMTSLYNGKLAAAIGCDESILGYGNAGKLRKWLTTLKPAERMRAAYLAINANDLAVHEYGAERKHYAPKGLERLAAILGVDHDIYLSAEQERQAAKDKPKEKGKKEKTTAAEKPAAKSAKKPKAKATKTPRKPAAKKTTKKGK